MEGIKKNHDEQVAPQGTICGFLNKEMDVLLKDSNPNEEDEDEEVDQFIEGTDSEQMKYYTEESEKVMKELVEKLATIG